MEEEVGVPAAQQTTTGEDSAESSRARERAQQCTEFAAITSCDHAVAQCYLAENDWHMERALNSFFEPLPEEGFGSDDPLSTESEEVPEKEQTLKPANALKDTCIDLTTDPAVAPSNRNVVAKQEDDSGLSFVTWNIDGLHEANLQERARGVCSFLALYSPDIVFLQEVIAPYLGYLEKRAVSYTIIPDTSMLRNLLTVQVNVSGNNLCLMTSHLESTKEHAKERINQLQIVLKKIQEAPESSTVLFAGDTNLRDQEVAKIGGLPSNVLDVWEFLGKPEQSRYTWDTTVNHNLRARYACRLRFDRIFLRASNNGGQFIPRTLDVIGTEKLDCGLFPSDHWGLLCVFDVIL